MNIIFRKLSGGMNFKKFLGVVAIYWLSCATGSCTKAVKTSDTDSDYEKTRVGGAEDNNAAVLSEGDGEVRAAITDSSRSTTLQASAGGGAAGSSVSFPPGALAVGSEVLIGEGSSIAGDLAAGDLGLEGNSMSSGGAAVAVTSPTAATLSSPMSLSLPLAASLALSGDRSQYLVVIYKVIADGGATKIGLLPRGDLSISGNSVTFSSKFFGVFQTAYTSQLVSVKKEADSATPILTAKDAKQLLPIAWKEKTPLISGPSSIAFAAAIVGISGVNKCTLIVDADKVTPWDTTGDIAVQGTDMVVPTKEYTRKKDEAHTVYGMFKCRASDGRETSSAWMTHEFSAFVPPPVLPNPPAVSGPAATNSIRPQWVWVSGGNGGDGNFAVKFGDDDFTTGTTYPTTATTFVPPADLAEGSHKLFVRERSAAGVWSPAASFEIIVDLTPPAPPVVTGPAITANQQPTWTWTSGGSGGAGLFRYKMDSNDFTSGSTNSALTSHQPGSSLTDAGYTLYVQEADAVGNWSASGQFLITVDSSGAVASASLYTEDTFSGGDVRYDDDTGIFFRWIAGSAASGVRDYTLHRFNLASCGGASVDTPGLTGLSQSFTGTQGTTYSFKVTTYANNGMFALSSCSGNITIDTTAPTGASSLVTEAAALAGDVRFDTTDTTIYFSWAAGSDAQSGIRDYTLMRYDQANCGGAATPTTGLASTSQSFVGANNSTYSFKVGTFNQSGLSTLSSCSGNITIDTTAPTNFTAYTAVPAPEFGSIKITLTMPGDVSDYNVVEVRRVAGSTAPNTSCNTDTLVTTLVTFVDQTFYDNGLSSGAPYSYRICLKDAAGNLNSNMQMANISAGSYVAFVTNALYNGNLKGTFDGKDFSRGLDGADYRCQFAAANASPPLPGFWRAFISDTMTKAVNRFYINAPIRTLTGAQVAADKTSLLSGSLGSPIDWTESAASSGGGWPTMTATNYDGNFAGNHCNDWTDGTSGASARLGMSNLSSASWSYNSSAGCDQTYHLYCISQKAPGLKFFHATQGIQQGSVKLQWDFPTIGGGGPNDVYSSVQFREKAGSVPPSDLCTDADGSASIHTIGDNNYSAGYYLRNGNTAGSFYSYRACVYDEAGNLQTSHPIANVAAMQGHYIFVTSTQYNGNLGGLSGADAICGSRATAAGLNSVTWKALLSDNAIPAVSHASVSGNVYTLVHHLIATASGDLFDGNHANRMVNEFGQVVSGTNIPVWTNFTSSGSVRGSSHCVDWSSSGVGDSGFQSFDDMSTTGSWATSSGNLPCNGMASLYCISQP